MSTAESFAKLAQSLGVTDSEPKLSCSYRLPESIVVSINSLAKIAGVNKSEIVSGILEIGCAHLADAIEENRPDLAHEQASKQDGEPVFDLCTPELARQVRKKFGKAVELDLSSEEY
jgi:hypothetical protein